MNVYYNKLMTLCEKASRKNCVPVSALIVKDNKIISSAYNLRKKTNNILDHAEIISIQKANKKLKTWNLSECEMYVTMKPCEMCMNIINESRIKKIHYLIDNVDYYERKEKDKKNIVFIKEKDYDNMCSNIIKKFFKKIREKD